MTHEDLLDAIAPQLRRPGTELSGTHALVSGGDVDGIVSTVNAGELRNAQTVSVAHLVRRLPPSNRQLAMARLTEHTRRSNPVRRRGSTWPGSRWQGSAAVTAWV